MEGLSGRTGLPSSSVMFVPPNSKAISRWAISMELGAARCGCPWVFDDPVVHHEPGTLELVAGSDRHDLPVQLWSPLEAIFKRVQDGVVAKVDLFFIASLICSPRL